MSDKREDSIESLERRRFFELMGKYGLTAAVVAGAAGVLGSREASAQTAKEEAERRKATEFTLTMASAFIIGSVRIYPIMQLDFKENVQNFTNGRVYVRLAPGGQLGAGPDLCQKVQQGTVQIGDNSPFLDPPNVASHVFFKPSSIQP